MLAPVVLWAVMDGSTQDVQRTEDNRLQFSDLLTYNFSSFTVVWFSSENSKAQIMRLFQIGVLHDGETFFILKRNGRIFRVLPVKASLHMSIP